MIKTDSDGYWRKDISDLYLKVYSEGLSKQKIDELSLKKLLDEIYSSGTMLVAVENSKLCGALMMMPALQDPLFPKEKLQNNNRTDYVAELMVDKEFRGRGLAGSLLKTAEENCVNRKIENMLIRVWSQNIPAVNLYLKNNYTELCRIDQMKRKPEGEEFLMEKIYLVKRIQ